MTAPWNGRPPAPLDERDGWHWIGMPHWGKEETEAAFWTGEGTGGWMRAGKSHLFYPKAFEGWQYLGACLTTDQVAAQIAEAVKAEREACAAACDRTRDDFCDVGYTGGPHNAFSERFAATECARAIRARGETQEP